MMALRACDDLRLKVRSQEEMDSARERPGTMSSLSVSTKQERSPQQPAGSGAKRSTSNQPLAESLLRLQRSAGNRATVALQRRFLSKTGDAPEVAVQPAAALDVLLKAGKGDTLARLGIVKDRPTTMAKLAEGTDIVYKDADELATAVNQRLTRFAGVTSAKSPARKLNRLAGQLQAKIALLRAHKPAKGMEAVPDEFITDLNDLLALVVEAKPAKDILELCGEILSSFTGYVDEFSPQGTWLCYNTVSTFGPLGYVLVPTDGSGKELQDLHDKNLAQLRNLRQLMAAREGVSVVAHRGTGPTNRTMGGLIQEEDQRRKNRPAENSPEAFEAALAETTKVPTTADAPVVPALDGVECDVFLSSDGVPMLSHEGKVLEQLNNLRKSAVTHQIKPRTEVSDMTASALKGTTRTGSAKSRFMTLQDLIDQVAPYATSYFDATGHPLRVEVEMKGTKADSHFDPSGKTSPLTIAVAKILSRAIKANPGLPVNYVLFNGTKGDVVKFSEIRQTKTALGGLYTGEGGAPQKWGERGELGPPDPKHIDELRYQFTAEASKDKIDAILASDPATLLPNATKWLGDYIVTLVYGQEFAPKAHPQYGSSLKAMEPSVNIEGGVDRNTDVTKPTARDYDDKLQRLLEIYVAAGGQTDRLHVLTDYPKKAAYLKEALAKVTPKAPEEPVATGESVEEVGSPSLPKSTVPDSSKVTPPSDRGVTAPSKPVPTLEARPVPSSVSPTSPVLEPAKTTVPEKSVKSSAGGTGGKASGATTSGKSPARGTATVRPAPVTVVANVTRVHSEGYAFASCVKGDIFIPKHLARGLREKQAIRVVIASGVKGLKATRIL